MIRLEIVIATIFWAVLPTSAIAQTGATPIIVEGKCDPKSGVWVGDDEKGDFECDIAVIARTERGTVLIQFTDKAGIDGRILGFAGTIEGKQSFGADPTQVIAVERLYLKGGGEPLTTSRGTCFLNWDKQKISSVLCGAGAEFDGKDIKAMAALTAH